MPVRKVKGGWKVGKGKTVYRTKTKANAVNAAIHAHEKKPR